MEIKEMQEHIKKFNVERDWVDTKRIKDFLLNMNEEIGEFWNIIKWVDHEEALELIRKHKEDTEDFIGDMMYLVLKLAFLCEVDAEKSIKDVMQEYEKRFPADKIKGNHANLRAGGLDLKYD